MKAEAEEGHEHNINVMTQVDEYKSPGKNKDASTINDSTYYESDEHKVLSDVHSIFSFFFWSGFRD